MVFEHARNFYPYCGAIHYYIFSLQTQRKNLIDVKKSTFWNINNVKQEVKGSPITDIVSAFASNTFYKFVFRKYSEVFYALGLISPPIQVDLLQRKRTSLREAIEKLELNIESYKILLSSDEQMISQDELLANEQSVEAKVKIAETEKLVANLRDELRLTNDKLSKEIRREQKLAKRKRNGEKAMQFLLNTATKVTNDIFFFPISKISIWYAVSPKSSNPSWLATAKRFLTGKGIDIYMGYLPQFLLSTFYSLLGPIVMQYFRQFTKLPLESEIMTEILPLLPSLADGVPTDDEIFSVLDKNKPLVVRIFRYFSKRSFAVVLIDWLFQMLFYPIVSVKNVMCVQGSSEFFDYQYADTLDCVQSIYSKDGVSGFYRGIKVFAFTIIPQCVTLGIVYVIGSILIEYLLNDITSTDEDTEEDTVLELANLQRDHALPPIDESESNESQYDANSSNNKSQLNSPSPISQIPDAQTPGLISQ